MRKRIVFAAIAALLTTAAFAPRVAAQEAKGIQGAWIFTDAEGQQRGLFIFTAANYSMMYVRGSEPRVVQTDEMTDEQAAASFREITANSGRYTLDGDQITYEAYMANSAAYMSGWPDNDQTATVKVDGDTLTWTNARGETFTMRRVG